MIDEEQLKKLIALRTGQPAIPPAISPQLPVEQPDVTPDPSNPYNLQARDDLQKAAALEAAAAPAPHPHAFMPNLLQGLNQLGAAIANPRAFPDYQLKQQEMERQRQMDLVGRARQYRTEAAQQQQMGMTASNQAANLKETERLRKLQEQKQAFDQAKGVMEPVGTRMVDPISGEMRSENPKPATAPNLTNFSKITAKYQGKVVDALEDLDPASPTKGHQFLQTAQGLQDVTGQLEHYEKPPAGAAGGSEAFQILQTAGANGPEYTRVRKVGPEGPIQIGQNTLQPKRAEAPAQLKNQADSAQITNQMIGIVRGYMKAKPYLTGPVAGRAAEYMIKFGGDPAQITAAIDAAPEGVEKDAATLAGHLAYLFLNEARATMPGRPAQAYMDFVKQRSAAMNQNPEVLEGFLRSAENNANIVLDTAAKAGYDMRNMQAPSGGKIRVRRKADGKTGTISESAFDPAKYDRVQ